MSTPTATPRTQALWMKHHAFFTEEEATEALCDFRDHGNLLETELAAAKAEAAKWKASHDNQVKLKSIIMSRPDLGDRAPRVVALMDELTRLRAELERFTGHGLLDDQRDAAIARAEKAEAALAFIAANGGTTHETECGPIACNGSWCAEQARAAIDAAMKEGSK